jgi:GDP-L-fucose synthase
MSAASILVTGATGFVGKRICRLLDARGLAYERTSLSLGVDLRDKRQALDLFARVRPEKVLHCAGFHGGIMFGRTYPADIFANNMPMIANLFEAAREQGVERIVNPISNCIYPKALELFQENRVWDGPMEENVEVYAMMRKSAWIGAKAYAKQYGLETINLVISNMYGPEDHFEEQRSHALGALVMKFVAAKRAGSPSVVVWGTGKAVREWIYVDDGAEAMIRALACEATSDLINVGIAEGVSVIELATRIKQIVGYEGEIMLDLSKPDGAPHKTVDGARGRALLGWSPGVRLEEGLKRTIDWYLEHGDGDGRA